METSLTADEAAAYLGIKKATLYAYVSRGHLESTADARDPRRRRYRRSDLDRLKRRSEAHAGEGPAAAAALDWGAPSLETAISRIGEDGPSYRGIPAAALVREGRTFEEVAELLWRGSFPSTPPPWVREAAPPDLNRVLEPDAWPIDVLRVATLLAGFDDPARFGDARDAELAVAGRLVGRVVRALAAHRDRLAPDAGGVAALLLEAFGGHVGTAEVRAVDGALVTVADHELNASTFAARVAASTGADVYACVGAALATFTGARHGGACDRCAALLEEVEAAGSARTVLTRRMQRGESPPGFGHPLYPEGDPRFAILTGIAAQLGAGPRSGVVDETVAAAVDVGLGFPTSDMGLLAVTRALDLPDAAAVTTFAVGRTAGWIAHAYEQRRQRWLLRPRARYVGR